MNGNIVDKLRFHLYLRTGVWFDRNRIKNTCITDIIPVNAVFPYTLKLSIGFVNKKAFDKLCKEAIV